METTRHTENNGIHRDCAAEQWPVRTLVVRHPGAAVTLRGDLPGVVLRTCIESGGEVRYCVAWWDGNDRHEAWVEAFEVQPRDEAKAVRIGFRG